VRALQHHPQNKESSAPSGDALPAGSTSVEIDSVAVAINEICRSATLDLAYRVGAVILDRLYGGNPEVWARDGTRRPSYRQLSARGDLLLSPSALCRAVSVYALCRRFDGRARWRNLSASHFQEAVPLQPLQQEALLDMANRERWTVTELRAEVARLRSVRPRQPAARLVRLINRFTAALAAASRSATFPSADSKQLTDAIDALRHRLARLNEAVRSSSSAEANLDVAPMSHSSSPPASGSIVVARRVV
jgi:hypothetical protein